MTAPASRGRLLAREFLALSENDFADFLEKIEKGESADDMAPEFRAELERRIRSIEDGSAVLLDGDEVMARLRSKFATR